MTCEKCGKKERPLVADSCAWEDEYCTCAKGLYEHVEHFANDSTKQESINRLTGYVKGRDIQEPDYKVMCSRLTEKLSIAIEGLKEIKNLWVKNTIDDALEIAEETLKQLGVDE